MPDGAMISVDQLNALETGLDGVFDTVETALETKAYVQDLPLVGEALSSAFARADTAVTAFKTFTTQVESALNTAISALPPGQGMTVSDFQAALQAAIDHTPLAGQVGVVLDGSGSLAVTLNETGASQVSQGLDLATDLGLPGLNLTAHGTAAASVGYTLNLGVHVTSTGQFSVDPSQTPVLDAHLDASAPTFGADASLGALNFHAADNGSSLTGDFAIGSDGSVTFTGGADLDLNLSADMGAADLPKIAAELKAGWSFEAGTTLTGATDAGFGAAPPTVEFDNVSYDFGDFVSHFIKPVLDELTPVLQPIHDALAVLNTEITPVEAVLGGSDPHALWRQLDVAGAVNAQGQESGDGKLTLLDFIQLGLTAAGSSFNLAPVNQVVTLVDQLIALDGLITNHQFGADSYDLGSYAILSDLRQAGAQAGQILTQVLQGAQDLSSFLQSQTANGFHASDAATGQTGAQLLSALFGAGSGVTSPFLTDPASAVQLLLGKSPDLLDLNLPDVTLPALGQVDASGLPTQFQTLLSIPVFSGVVADVSVALKAALALSVGLTAGFDTSGLTAYAAGLAAGTSPDPSTILDGLFIQNPTVNGAPGPILKLLGDIALNADVDAFGGAADVSGGGYIGGELDLALPTNDKVYLNTLLQQLESNPLSVLQATGKVSAGFDLGVSVLGQDVWSKVAPAATLFSFTTGSGGSGSGASSGSGQASLPVFSSASVVAIDGAPVPAAGVHLGGGHTVQIALQFTGAVQASGAPTITLNDGATATYDAAATAALHDPTELLFDYTTSASDRAIPALGFTGVTLNGGALTDPDGHNLTLTGLDQVYFPGVVIETTAPSVSYVTLGSVDGDPLTSTGDLSVGHQVQFVVTFSHEVNLSGAPELHLNTGGVAVYDAAATSALNDPTQLVFDYTVGPQDVATTSLAVTGLDLNGGSLADSAGNAAALSAATHTFPGLQALEPGFVVTDVGFADGPHVAASADGHVLAVGQPYGGAASGQLSARLFDPSGALVATTALAPDGAAYHSGSAIPLSGGGYLVAWGVGPDSGSASTGLAAQALDASGAPVGPGFTLSAGDVAGQTYSEFSSVAQLADGNLVFVWTNGVAGTSNETAVNAQIVTTSGAAVSGIIPLSGYDAIDNGTAITEHGSVAALAGGGFAVTYSDGNDWLQTQTFTSAGQAVGEPLCFNTGGDTDLAAASLSGGGYVAVWDDRYHVYAQAFTASGQEAGDRVVVASSDYFGGLSVTGLADGGYDVSWSGRVEVGSTVIYGVLNQAFDAAGDPRGPQQLIAEPNGAETVGTATLPGGALALGVHNSEDAEYSELYVLNPAAPNLADVSLPASGLVRVDPSQATPIATALPAAWNIPFDGQDVTVAYSVQHGTLSVVPQLLDPQFHQTIDGSGASVLTLSGTEATLAGETPAYTPDPGYLGPDTLTVTLTQGRLVQTFTEALLVDATPTGAVTISGGGRAGDLLTADTSALADGDGLGQLHYQWALVTPDPVTETLVATPVGSDSATYQTSASQAGQEIRLTVSYTDGRGVAETVSAQDVVLSSPAVQGPSTPLITANPAVVATARPTIQGTADPGDVVSLQLDGQFTGVLATADQQGRWSASFSFDLSAGPHEVTAIAHDLATNTLSAVSAGDDFTVDLSGTQGSGAIAVSGLGPITLADTATATPFASVTLGDPSPGQTETAVVSLSASAGSLSGLGTAGTVDGAESYTVSGTAAVVQSELRAAVFTPAAATSGAPPTVTTVTLAVSESGATTGTAQTVITTTHGAGPSLSGLDSALSTPVPAGGATSLAPLLTLAEADPAVMISSAVVAITSGFTAGDRLVLSAPSGLAAHYDPATGILTLSGAGTEADYQAALRDVAYAPGVGDADGPRQITFSVADVHGDAATAVETVSVEAQAPAGGGADDGGATSPPPAPTPAQVQQTLPVQLDNLTRASAGDPALSDPSSPLYAQAQAEAAISSKLDAGLISAADAETQMFHLVDGTTSVAEITYDFFTGATPTAAGLDYLVHSSANPTDLNDAYYAQFSTENRYINFAANLGRFGDGTTPFHAAFDGLSLADATAKAYQEIFGTVPTAEKVDALLNALVPDGLGGSETRAQYFAYYGADGPNGIGTKSAMIGWLLADSVKEGLGTYQQAEMNFLAALAHGSAQYNVDLLSTYGQPPALVGLASSDPTVGH